LSNSEKISRRHYTKNRKREGVLEKITETGLLRLKRKLARNVDGAKDFRPASIGKRGKAHEVRERAKLTSKLYACWKVEKKNGQVKSR